MWDKHGHVVISAFNLILNLSIDFSSVRKFSRKSTVSNIWPDNNVRICILKLGRKGFKRVRVYES